MITLDLILKILITSFMLYLTLNTVFRYHFSIERFLLLFLLAFFLIMVNFTETDKIFEFIITVFTAFIIYFGINIYQKQKQISGYVLFNTFKKDYPAVLEDIKRLSKDIDINPSNICYNQNKPFLVVIKNEHRIVAKTLFKKLDEIYTKKKIRLTMYNYWSFVVFLILEVALWRF